MNENADNSTQSESSHPIDELVRRQLEMDAAALSVDRLRSRVMTSLTSYVDAPSDLKPRRNQAGTARLSALYRRWYSKAAAVLIAVGLLVAAFLAGRFDNVAYADASEVVRAAKLTHAGPIERLYVMTVQKSESSFGEFRIPNDVQVHVLGDRFWVEMNRGDRHCVWGRDESGSVWIVPASGRAMTVSPNEIGPVLNHLCDVCSLNTETLLDDVLANCQLDQVESDASFYRIHAKAHRTSRTGIRSAVLDIDRETKAIRRLQIDRVRPTRFASTVEFTLVESKAADESKYSVAGHTQNSGEVMSRSSRIDRRRELLNNFLGVPAERWILPGGR